MAGVAIRLRSTGAEPIRRQGDKESGRQGDKEFKSPCLPLSLSPCLSVSAPWPQCHISGGASAIDEQKRRLRAGARERRFQVLDGADGLAIDLLDHIARSQSG